MFAEAFSTALSHEPNSRLSVQRALVAVRSWFRAIQVTVRQLACAVHGHEMLLHAAHDRMFLECIDCGHRSRGWDVKVPATRRRG